MCACNVMPNRGTMLRHVLLLVALLVVCCATARAQCPVGLLDFAPSNTTNSPAAWNSASQLDAGNINPGVLWPIATYGKELGGVDGDTLVLNFKPVHPVLAQGAAVSPNCADTTPIRRLLQAGAGAVVTKAATYTWSWTLDGLPAGGSSTPALLTAPAPKVLLNPWLARLANVSGSAGAWLSLAWSLHVSERIYCVVLQGKHTIVIKVTINAASGTLKPTVGPARPSPGRDLTIVSAPIEFYFFGLNSRPSASAAFNSCAAACRWHRLDPATLLLTRDVPDRDMGTT
jgi:hypothetical protein